MDNLETHPTIGYSLQVLGQLGQVLGQLGQARYQLPQPLLQGSTLGGHTRHIIEFYRCLLASHHGGVLCYDARPRDQALETDLAQASQALALVQQQLQALASVPDSTLVLQAMVLGSPHLQAADSTLHRELLFVADHAVHHLALMKLAIAHQHPDVVLPSTLGYAASTLKHQA